MFADATLGARIDGAEARLCAAIANAVGRARPEARVLVQPIGGGLAVFAGAGSPVNKVMGLGFDGPVDPDSLEAVEQAWRDRGEPMRVELSVLADASIPPALGARGYVVHGFENVLGLPLDDRRTSSPIAAAVPKLTAVPGLTIETLRPADVPLWSDVAAEAFSTLDGTGSVPDDQFSRETLAQVMTDFTAAPGWIGYLARVDGEPVGTASLCLHEGLAHLAGAGIRPAFRGRGIQNALLQRRLADARAADCNLAIVMTAPGTRSQANVMKRGFVQLYTRAIFLKRRDA